MSDAPGHAIIVDVVHPGRNRSDSIHGEAEGARSRSVQHCTGIAPGWCVCCDASSLRIGDGVVTSSCGTRNAASGGLLPALPRQEAYR